jgi:hypothetical protein
MAPPPLPPEYQPMSFGGKNLKKGKSKKRNKEKRQKIKEKFKLKG